MIDKHLTAVLFSQFRQELEVALILLSANRFLRLVGIQKVSDQKSQERKSCPRQIAQTAKWNQQIGETNKFSDRDVRQRKLPDTGATQCKGSILGPMRQSLQ